MSAEQFVSVSAEDRAAFLSFRTRLLVRELSDFANNNRNFKRGASDYVAIEAVDGDYIEPEDDLAGQYRVDEAEDDEDEQILPTSHMEFRYSFEADRSRSIDKLGRQRAYVAYVFSVTGLHRNVLLPAHIAEEAIGLPAQEAQEEVGPVSLRHELRFTLVTDMARLMVCESFAYLDDEDFPISEKCSCSSDSEEVTYYLPDDDVEGALQGTSEIRQSATIDLKERLDHERLSFEELNEPIQLLDAMQAMGVRIHESGVESMVDNARSTFRSVRRAIMAQAGVEA